MNEDLIRLPATRVLALLASRKINALEYVSACLDRIAAREKVIGAWTHLEPGQACAAARALDEGRAQCPLHGMPVGIKDIIDVVGMPAAYGSPIYRDHRPAWDAACVSELRAAGSIVLGKTVTTEFASSHPGGTRNPHNPAYTPGGSSSGSAAAVADFMIPFALGTQTGGSVIRPASFCGVVGYKPSFGLIDRRGVKPLSESLDTVGMFARTVADVALLASAVTRRPALAGMTCPLPPRIGLWRAAEWSEAAAETVETLQDAAAKLRASGASVRELDAPTAFADLMPAHHDIESYEMARALSYEMNNYSTMLSARLRARLEHGTHCPPEVYDAHRAAAQRGRIAMERMWNDVDVLIAPSAPGEAPEGLTSTGNSVFNRLWTLLYLPCISVPGYSGPSGLPIGVQVIGRHWHDAETLARASWIHEVLAQ